MKPLRLLPLLPLLLSTPALLHADVKMPAIFGDHMVLQRDLAIPVWGWADPGEAVTVTLGTGANAATATATATAGDDGAWKVKLPANGAAAAPTELSVKGKNSLLFKDVLVGDVWVCSGQSNMEFGIGSFATPAEIDAAGDEQLRLFSVPKRVSPSPEKDVDAAPPKFPMLASWQVCTPESLRKSGEWSGFTAVGYYFGKELRLYTKQPVGLVESCWGGTRIQSWISLAMLETMPNKASAAKGAANFRDHYQEIGQAYATAYQQWKEASDKWEAENKDALASFGKAMDEWRAQSRAAGAQGQAGPPKPVEPKFNQKQPRDPIHDNANSTALFNGMIAPLIPYGIKGVLWYQGESNGDEALTYATELPALIKDWRGQWGEGEFPFLVVQLPNFLARKPEPGDGNWATMREVQAKTAEAVPNAGYIVTIDLGDASNIHPPDKADVGYRAAGVARRVAYGDATASFPGPRYQSATVEGAAIRIAFDKTSLGGGLVIGNPPERFFTANKKPVPTAPPSELEGFAIAGADGKYVWAKAKIDGDTVVVSSDAVPQPATVRYAWADNPACNLYNKEGLPAAPFRTDTVPLPGK